MKFGSVAGRINDARFAFPQLVDVTFGPRRIDHDFEAEGTDEAIEAGEDEIIKEFAFGEGGVVSDKTRVIEGAFPAANALQHIRRDRWVMDVRSD